MNIEKEMEKLPFNKKVLLEKLKIGKNSYGGLNIKLINNNVTIILSTIADLPGELELDAFYKGIEKKGIARCALYVLLLELVERKVIKEPEKEILKVYAPTPDDGDMERLIKIYNQIGFTEGGKEVGRPLNLNSTIKNLINTLKEQCEIKGGGRRRKYRKKRTRKRRKSRRKSRRKKRRKRRR